MRKMKWTVEKHELVFDGQPSELTRQRFKEVYGEEAEVVSVGGMDADLD